MTYAVFDLDATLADVHTIFMFLCMLKKQRSYQYVNPNRSVPPPDPLIVPLRTAYAHFVQHFAEEEASDNPIGLLRPGILGVFHELSELQKEGFLSGVAIYSNNAGPQNLEFVRDVLAAAVDNPQLFVDIIDWNHPEREIETPKPKRKGYADKTWAVLSKILKEGPARAPAALAPTDVWFFDDQIHPDLQRVLGDHYIHIPGYAFKANFDRIADMYLQALDAAGIMRNPQLLQMFFNYASEHCAGGTSRHNQLDKHFELLEQATGKTAGIEVPVPQPDSAIDQMFEAIGSMQVAPGAAAAPSSGPNLNLVNFQRPVLPPAPMPGAIGNGAAGYNQFGLPNNANQFNANLRNFLGPGVVGNNTRKRKLGNRNNNNNNNRVNNPKSPKRPRGRKSRRSNRR